MILGEAWRERRVCVGSKIQCDARCDKCAVRRNAFLSYAFFDMYKKPHLDLCG